MADYRLWVVSWAENEEWDTKIVPADCAQGAALSWVRDRCEEVEDRPDEHPLEVHVRAPDGTVTRWSVSADVTTTYNARLLHGVDR